MNAIFELTLGIITSTGGFLDLGQLVFLGQAGAKFAYALVWSVALATVGLIVYGEMAGRLAAVSKVGVFDAVRNELPRGVGIIAAAATMLTTLITCAAEVGGMALVLELAFSLPYWLGVLLALIFLGAVLWFLPFPWIEKGFGILGLGMLVFLAAAFFLQPDWYALLQGFVPQLPQDTSTPNLLLYGYFVVGMISAVLMPYELIFYSAGAIEEKWGVKDLPTNRIVTIAGFSFGSIVAVAVLACAAVLFAAYHIDPQLLGSVALQAVLPFGKWGLWIALSGIFFAVSGAALETALSNAYVAGQLWDKPWGKSKRFSEAPLFYISWILTLLVGAAIALWGPGPIKVAEYAVVFSTLALPLSYAAILLSANDKKLLGKHANGRVVNILAIIFLAIIVAVAVAAIPLLLITSAGSIAS